MIFGNDRIKLMFFILLISIIIFAATIVAGINVFVTIIVGIVMLFLIMAIVLYGFEDEK